MGSDAMMRGALRPAAAAAAVMVGVTWLAIVFTPVIHSNVPSHNWPAVSSILGPSAATNRSGVRTSRGPTAPESDVTVTRSPVVATALAAQHRRQGLEVLAHVARRTVEGSPHMPSTMTWCDRPTPSESLPPMASWTVRA